MKLITRLLGVLSALGLLGLVLGYLAGFFSTKIEPDTLNVAREIPEGEVAAVQVVEEPVVEHATGTVRAKNETIISSRITATIASVAVRAGDAVEKDELLLTLDNRELQARVAQQREAVAAAEARFAEAEPNYDRIRSLFERKVASKADLDRARAELQTAQAELSRVQRAADEAGAALSYSVIRAPLSGRIIDRFADPGDTAIPGTPLLKLYDPEHLRLEANVRESLASRLKRGDELRARIDALNQSYPVLIDEIVPSADPGSRTFLVKATLPPTQARLYPGMFGRLLIASGSAERFYIPGEALSRVGQLEFVNVVTEAGAMRRFIRIGARGANNRVEVLSGLAPDERVLLASP